MIGAARAGHASAARVAPSLARHVQQAQAQRDARTLKRPKLQTDVLGWSTRLWWCMPARGLSTAHQHGGMGRGQRPKVGEGERQEESHQRAAPGGAQADAKPDRSNEEQGERATKLPTMEANLRKLYLRVHPDLFAAHPEAREENEKSFQLLSEFLTAIKNQDGAGRGSAGKRFVLTFNLRPEAESGLSEERRDLERVEVSLRADGSPKDKKKQLSNLFAACGIKGDFTFDARGGSVGGGGWGGGGGGGAEGVASEFELFVREQARAAAAAQAEHQRVWQEVYALQHALQLQHRVRVAFGGSNVDWNAAARIQALEQMLAAGTTSAIDDARVSRMGGAGAGKGPDGAHGGVGVSVETLNVILGDCNDIDRDGRVILAGQDPQTWPQHLQSIDWAHVAQAEARMKQVRVLERDAAEHLGLAFVHGETAEMEFSAAYAHFLAALCSESEASGFVRHSPRRSQSGEGGGGAEPGGAVMQRPVLLVQRLVCADAPDMVT